MESQDKTQNIQQQSAPTPPPVNQQNTEPQNTEQESKNQSSVSTPTPEVNPTSEQTQQPQSQTPTLKMPSLGVKSVIAQSAKLNKKFGFNKITRLLLFFFFFFFIFKIIDKIFIFFNINRDVGYVYFIWATLFFFLFVILPLRKSYLTR